MLGLQFLDFFGPNPEQIIGIRKPYRSVGMDRDIVGPIKPFLLITISYKGNGSILFITDDPGWSGAGLNALASLLGFLSSMAPVFSRQT